MLVDWDNPNNNDFAVAEEVTLRGARERRPDLVLYVNGIALGVVELKSSRVAVEQGIRQLISNQNRKFNKAFFGTVQLLVAGNDSQGVRYGAIGTPVQKFWRWKSETAAGGVGGCLLDAHLRDLCGRIRLLELVYEFVVFARGVKMLPRPHQFFAVC